MDYPTSMFHGKFNTGWPVDGDSATGIFNRSRCPFVRPTFAGLDVDHGFLGRLLMGRGPFVYCLWRFPVGRKLYCGNLEFSVSSSDLEQLFSEFGHVQSAQVIADRDTGRSKGFGFVEMSTDAEAQAAIQGLNDREHAGRALAVNEARPRENRGGGGGGRGGYSGGGGGGGRGRRY